MITLNGQDAHSVMLDVHELGCWTAEVQVDADEMSGKVTLALDGVTFTGKVVRAAKDQAWLHVEIQGGAGWATELPPKSYAVNDAGNKVQMLIEDVARTVGETIGNVQLSQPRLGSHYVRDAGKASLALQDCLRGTNWWVDYAGVTQVGPRPSRTLKDGFVLVEYLREDNEAIVNVDSADSILPGDVIVHELIPEGFTVKSLTLRWDDKAYLQMTVRGDDESDTLSLVQRIVEKKMREQLTGTYEYRVVSQSGQKLDLQATHRKSLPDLKRVPIWPSVPGAEYQLPAGMRCLVQFINADRSRPVVTNFVDETDGNFKPTKVTFTSPLDVEGEVTGKSNIPLQKVGLTSHFHKTPTGPSDPPQGGS